MIQFFLNQIKSLSYIFILLSFYEANSQNIKIVDLELKSEVNLVKLEQGGIGVITLTLSNKSSVNHASNVEVIINTPYTPPFSIFQSYSSSLGIFSIKSNVWSISSISPGSEAKLTLRYKLVTSGIWYIEGEIAKVDQQDSDSTPFNFKENEDDFSRSCISIPINVSNQSFPGMQFFVKDSSLSITNWKKDSLDYPNVNPNILQFNSVGTYMYNQTTFKCPTQGCCPLIVQEEISLNSCCQPLEYTMERIYPFTTISNTEIPLNGLISYFSFNGSTFDSINTNNSLNIVNSGFSNGISGERNSSIQFSGSNSYGIINNSYDLIEKSINLWFRANDLTINSPYLSIFQSDNELLNYGNIGISILNVNGLPTCQLTMSGVSERFVVEKDTWYNVAITLDSSKNLAFYLNGTLLNKLKVSSYLSSSSGLKSSVLGSNRFSTNSFFNGIIDEFRIYNRALNSEEVKSIYLKK